MDEALVDRIRKSISTAASNPQQAQPAPSPQPEPNTGIGKDLNAVAEENRAGFETLTNAVVGGARDALQGTWDTASAVAPAVSQWADRNGLNVLGMKPIQDGDKGPQLPEVPKADESTAGGVVANTARDLERFFLGFAGAGAVMRGMGVATNTFKGATAAGAVGDFLVTGANDKRLVDLFDAIPGLQGPMLDALRTDGNEDLWKHKLAAALEGSVFGAGIEGVVRGVGALRNIIKAQKTGDPKVIQAAVEAAEPELQAAAQEIKAWHGSPYSFDQFEVRPFTGEGTQSFGHGIYLAENEGVARYYQKLGENKLGPISEMLPEYYKEGNIVPAYGGYDKVLKFNKGTPSDGGVLGDWSVEVVRVKPDGTAIHGERPRTHQTIPEASRIQEVLGRKMGNLYEVKVKASADEMLDWDAPLSQQPQKVRDAVEAFAAKHPDEWTSAMNPLRHAGEEPRGEDVYRAISKVLDLSDEAASEYLRSEGIPGLRFLDAGSRGKTDPEAALTRNMVIFDPKSAEITARNGQPIPQKPPPVVSPSGQVELFPEVVRREEAIQDIQLQIKGDRYMDPETGKEKILPISNRAREELTTAFKDPASPLHIDKLTPETRDELLRALASDNEAARFFNPKTVRGKPFALDDARRADFDAAVERSLTIPYATLKAENPGVAIEDTLSTFLNYRYMDSPDTVKATLDDLTRTMAPLVEKHVGGFPQTFEKVQELADWIGTKPDTLTALLSQQARAAEYMPAAVVAAKTWVQSLTRDIVSISKQIASGVATDTAKIELVRRQDILGDLISTLKAVQTSSARTTAAGRIRTADSLTQEEIAALIREVGEDNFRFLSRKLSLTEGEPKAVIAMLEPTFGQKFWGVTNEVWINGLLSGLGTHIVNFAGGIRNTLLYPSFRIAGGALTGDTRSIQLGLAQYAGLKDSVFGAFEMAARSLRTENAYVDASFHQVERERLWVKAETFGLDGEDVLGKGIDYLGTAIRMSSRFLTSSDEFLKQLNYRASVHARARTEAYERGLSDEKNVSYFVDGQQKMLSQVDEYVRDRMHEAFHPRRENGLDERALADARKATFTSPLKEATWYNGPTLGERAQEAAARIPPLRHLVLPFVRVPANIFRAMIYESPAAPLRAQFWQDMKAGGEARSDAVGRFAMGSLFWTGTAMLAAEGIITGKGPTDPVLAAQWKLDGKQPYSIKFPGAGEGGKDLWIDYSRLGDQWAGMLGIAADAAYIMAHVDERTQDQLAMTMTLALANNLNNRGYLRSLTELLAVIGAAATPQAAQMAQRWLNSRAASYVPRVVDSLNPDDQMREVRGMLDAIYAKVPGLSTLLDAKVDNFGVPIAPAVGWPINEINPFKLSLTKPGAARKELAYWADSPARAQFEMPSPTIEGVIDLRDFKNTETGQSAFSRWMQVLTEPKFAGKTFEERMNGIAESDGYKRLKAEGKEDPIYRKHPAVEFLREQMTDHYKMAREMMLKEKGFEELNGALAQYEQNKQVVPAGRAPRSNPTLEELLKMKR